MNFKQKAEKLEHFLEEEFSKKLPIAVLSDKSLVYKTFRIKQTKQGPWALRWAKTGDFIDNFRTKTGALLAAKFYDTNRFDRYNEVKILDLKDRKSVV